MSGGDTLLMFSDQFRDHLHHIASSDAAMIRLLKQWQLSSQVKMLFSKGFLATLVVSGTVYDEIVTIRFTDTITFLDTYNVEYKA